MKNRVATAVSLLLLVSAAPVAGQRITSPYRFIDHSQFAGVHAGYVSTSDRVAEIGPKSGPLIGATWGYRVAGPLTIGADLSFLPTTRTVRDTALVLADSTYTAVGEADVKMLIGMVNLRLDLTGQRTWHSLQPFVVVGGGAAVDLAGAPTIDEDLGADVRYDFGTSFAGQLGAGVDWFPGSRVSVRLDGRSILWKLTAPEAFQVLLRTRKLPSTEWAQNFAVAAGISIHF